MNTVTIGVIIALIVYGIFVAVISSKAGKSTTTSADYLVAGRNVGTVTLIATVCLSIWSALVFYGVAGATYREGIGYMAGVPGASFAFSLMAPTLMYRLWLLGKQYGYTTPGDFFVHRYHSPALKKLIAVICTVCIVPYISVQVSGVANGIVTTTEGTIGFWVVAAILVVYMYAHVLSGGNKAVVGTDLFAAIVGLSIVLITTITFVVRIPGNFTNAANQIALEGSPVLTMFGQYSRWLPYVGLSMAAGTSAIVWPHIFVRSYMAKEEKVFRVMGVAFPIMQFICLFCFMVQGIYVGHTAYPGLEGAVSDNIVPMMALEYLPAILTICLVIGVFAFGLSTADSQLVVASSLITHDLLRKEGEEEKNTKKNNAVWLTIIMVFVLLTVYFRPPFLVTYAYSFCTPGFAQLMPAMIGGLFWKRGTKEGAIAGTLGGMLTVLFVLFVKNPWSELHPILWGLLVNVVLYVVVSLMTKQDEKAVREIHEPLSKFFESRNNNLQKVLLALFAVVYVQAHVIGVYLPNDHLLFGWCPPTVLNYFLVCVEFSILSFFYGKNRLYEADGSKKDFADFVPKEGTVS